MACQILGMKYRLFYRGMYVLNESIFSTVAWRQFWNFEKPYQFFTDLSTSFFDNTS